MNKMKEVSQLLGVETGEEFKINGLNNTFHLSYQGLCNREGSRHPSILMGLLTGMYEVEKTPFKPKQGEKYWSVGLDSDFFAYYFKWDNSAVDYIQYKCGLVFRTEKEAKEIGIPKLKQIIDEFNNET